MDRSLFTANFKRDYVAFAAVVIFFLIVASELALAISIPAYFVKSDLWAVNIQRQKLFNNFDSTRNACSRAKIRDYEADEENKLIFWTLNMMANYLRSERNKMSAAQATELLKDVRSLQLVAGRVQSGKSYNQELDLTKNKAETLLVKHLATPVKKEAEKK